MVLLALIGVLILSSAAFAEWQIRIEASEHDRPGTVFVADLPDDFPQQPLGETMVDVGSAEHVMVQADYQRKSIRWIDTIDAGATRIYELRFRQNGDSAAYQDKAVVRDDGQALVLSSGGAKVTYQHAEMPSPDPDKPFHARSGFIHGIRTPSGRLVTDPMPADHLHQHGVMLAWRNTEFEGRQVNFWEDAAQQGRISHHETVFKKSGPVFGEIEVRLKHVDTTAPDGAKQVLAETWRVQAYSLKPNARLGTPREFVWDFESIQTNVTDSPLKMTKFHYGGFMVRGAAEWINAPHQMLTSLGDSQATGNHTRPLWVDINGMVDGEHVGLTTMGHPSNFRFPQPVRLHPSMPYYCFAPMVGGAFEIAPGESFRSRYRFIAHDGPLERRRAVAHWRDWSEPPKVTVSQVNQPRDD